MDTRTRQPTSWSRVLVFLAAMVAALAAILVGNLSSASAAGVAETRVGASRVVVEPFVGPPERIAAGQRLGNAPSRVVTVVATGVAANTGGSTRAYRVEGPGNARLDINAAGDVSIKGDSTLFLNFGDEARAQDFLAQRLAQGFEGTRIKSFEVPTSYFDDLVSRSVPESMARTGSVFQVDTTKTAGSFGLRSSEFARLQCAIIPGSGC